MKTAFRCIQQIPYIITPNDKDAGFSFTHLSEARQLEESTMQTKYYQPVRLHDYNFRTMLTAFRGLASRIQRHDGAPGLAATLCKPLDNVFPALLGYTIKTHKAAGAIVPGPLHKALQLAFEGFSLWLCQRLRPELHKLHHLLHDSREFCRRVHGQPFASGSRMAVVDVKDFYLSGDAVELSSDVAMPFAEPLASLVRETAFMLFDNQYVFSTILQAFYRCYKGTGMGLRHSGFCANIAFYFAVERNFINNLKEHNIQFYGRYHDDVYIIFTSKESMDKFLHPLISSSRYFKLLASGVSSTSIDYLDLTVAAVDGHLRVQPTLAKIPCPLPWSSCHARSVHSTWPQAVARRVADLACDKLAAIDRLTYVYRVANADPRTLSLLCDSSRNLLKASRTSDNTIICVLRFHPAFAYAFRKALRAVPVPPDVPFTIVPSWRNALPSTMSVVGKANRHNASSTMFNNQGIPHLGVVEGGKVVVVVPPSSNKYSPVTNVTIMSPNFLDTLFNNLNS
jgi:hypothetical protein